MTALPPEFSLIARHFAPLALSEPGARGLADDAAVLTPPPGRDLVMTTDTMVAGVHYPPETAPGRVAAKLLRVNLSDLAAMGAEPWVYTLALALSKPLDEPWVAAFAAALAGEQRLWRITLVGGDTVALDGPSVATIAAYGTVAPGAAVGRAGARVGDGVYVSGAIGDAALGLALRQGRLDVADPAVRGALIDRLELPTPRLALARRLAGRATAAADISDGLVADLGHITAASGVCARISAAAVPLSPAARAALAVARLTMRKPISPIELLSAGDDYELVFTSPPAAAPAVESLAAGGDCTVTRIGWIVAGEGVEVIDGEGHAIPIAHQGYAHFAAGEGRSP